MAENQPGKQASDPEFMEYVRVDPSTGKLMQLESKGADIQKPTAPHPPPPEIVPKESIALAIVTSPDVCRSPQAPIPYMTWGKGSDNLSYSPDVRANGQVIKLQSSKFWCCYGDEPGTGLGIKSNTVGDIVEPVTSSTIVRANGLWVQRHTDRCTLNKGNAPGEYVLVKSVQTDKAPDGKDNQDKTRDEQIAEYAASKGWTRASDGGWNTNPGGFGWASNEKVGEEMDYVNSGQGHVQPFSMGSGPSEIKPYTPSWTENIEHSVQERLMSWGMDKYEAGEYGRKVGGLAGFVPGLGNGLSANDASRSFSSGQYLLGGIQSIGAVIGIGPGRLLTKGLEKGAEKVVQNQVERATVKALEEKAAKEAAEAAAKKEADEAAATVSGKAGARVTKKKKKSLRLQYLGKTPGKKTKVGDAVRERMRKEGNLRTNPETLLDEFKADNGKWYPVDSQQTHMGHHPVDAVDYWNKEGRYYGAKSEEVRDWMNDPNNYRFEYGPENSSRGGQTPSRYLPPVKQ